jgi:hypothetical protein
MLIPSIRLKYFDTDSTVSHPNFVLLETPDLRDTLNQKALGVIERVSNKLTGRMWDFYILFESVVVCWLRF